MIKYKQYIIALILSLVSLVSSAQDEAKIKVIARPYQDSIKLRWAPDNPVAWHFLNEYGYKIERFTLMRNDELLEEPDSLILPNTFKPEPLKKWEPYADNDYVAIAAEAIYGESLEVTHGIVGADIMQVINRSKELESKFSFALLAADFSPLTAELSGLTFTDKSVKKNEKYLYIITSRVPVEKIKIDTGYVYVGVDDFKPMPQPIDVRGDFSDQSTMISWNHQYFENIFIAYQVERSDDNGKTFKPISDDPLINATKAAYKTPERMFIIDSLPQNDKEYFYRVRGITSFGEISPASDTVSGYGYQRLPVNPSISDVKVFSNKIATLTWEFPDSLNHLIDGFKLLRSVNDKGPFDTINQKKIPADERKIADEPPYSYNYYKIVAQDHYGHDYQSYPYMVQIIDSIPPVKPVGMNGIVDSTGIVQLSWTNNSEKDLLGYRVFRSNFRNSEFAQITLNPVSDTTYLDTINIKTLTRKIYYKIQAVDQHYNPSEFSEVFELSRPDIIPPVSPVFYGYETDETGIHIQWHNSSSIDVEKHVLYRQDENESGWRVIAVFYPRDSISEFTDSLTIEGQNYKYTMLAVDEAGLESKPVKPIQIRQYENKVKPPVTEISYDVDRQEKYIKLVWEYEEPNVKKFLIYRGNAVENLSFYTSVHEYEFTDKKLMVNNTYLYVIKAVFANGNESKMSNVVEIKY